MTGAIVLEKSFNDETCIKAVNALLNEYGLTACPLWNVTKKKHEVLFKNMKKIKTVPIQSGMNSPDACLTLP